VAEDGTGGILMQWTDSKLTVATKSQDKGTVEATVTVQTEGGEGSVGINVRYLLDYLSGRDGMVAMEVTTDKSPILFRHSSSPLVVIMPMQLK
jgi:DNA polymerase III sliding clamp (beta) subunit (PCNA family)